MTVSVSWLKKQMVQFTKVAKAKSGSLWCKPADGEKKHAHCCTLHTHCVFLLFFFTCPCCLYWLYIIQRWRGRTSRTCTTAWSTTTAARRRQVGPALIGPLPPVCTFIFFSSLKHFTSSIQRLNYSCTLNKDMLYKHSFIKRTQKNFL